MKNIEVNNGSLGKRAEICGKEQFGIDTIDAKKCAKPENGKSGVILGYGITFCIFFYPTCPSFSKKDNERRIAHH